MTLPERLEEIAGKLLKTKDYSTFSHAIYQAAIELRQSSLPKETAWLIEMPAARWGTGFYWIGVQEYGSWGEIDKAVRFARKEDAERVIETLHAEDKRKYGYQHSLKYEACEHSWPVLDVRQGSDTPAPAPVRVVPHKCGTGTEF